jgi:hypothetical protein
MIIDHEWEEQELETDEKLHIESEAVDPVTKEKTPVIFDFSLHFIVAVQSLRICKLCGAESVDGKLPEEDCGTTMVRQIMIS